MVARTTVHAANAAGPVSTMLSDVIAHCLSCSRTFDV